MWTTSFSRALADAFERAQSRNKAISMRAFAQHLDIAPGMLSEILRERRVISFKRALEICEKAGLSKEAIDKLRRLHDAGSGETKRTVLGGQIAELILNRDYYRLLCSLEILPAPVTLAQVAEYLEMSAEDLKPIVDVLVQLEVIRTDGKALVWGGDYLTLQEDVPSKKIQAFHRTNLEDAATALDLPVGEREFSSVTFAATKSEIEVAKKIMRGVRDKVPQAMRGESPDTIYQFSMQLRPLSRTRGTTK